MAVAKPMLTEFGIHHRLESVQAIPSQSGRNTIVCKVIGKCDSEFSRSAAASRLSDAFFANMAKIVFFAG